VSLPSKEDLVFRTKSKTQRAADKARAQTDQAAAESSVSDQLRDRVGPAMERVAPVVSHAHATAHEAASAARGWGQPRVEAARDWSQPHVEAAREWAKPRVEHGIEVAAPRLEHAVSGLAPKVDHARDKIVDDLLPKVAAAIAAAAAAGAAAKDEAVSRSDEAVSRGKGAAHVLAGDSVARPKRSKGKILLVLGLLAAAGAAVAAFLKKSAPEDDPWATPLADPYVAPATGRDSTVTAPATESRAGADAATEAEPESTNDDQSARVAEARRGDAKDIIDLTGDNIGETGTNDRSHS